MISLFQVTDTLLPQQVLVNLLPYFILSLAFLSFFSTSQTLVTSWLLASNGPIQGFASVRYENEIYALNYETALIFKKSHDIALIDYI